VLDEISQELLRRQGLTLAAIPAAGRAVLIHYNGDLTVDETDRMHPDVAQSCVVAAQTVGLDVAGIDVIAEDIGRPLEAQDGAVIEVNAGPGLVMHLKPLVGRPRPVGEAIVEHLFPAAEDGRIPLIAVSGTNGKTLVASMVTSMLTAAGRMVGLAGSHGLYVGARPLAKGDCADAASARRLLVNPFVDAIVLETSEISVLREGLAFDRCQVAVVTNLGSADHLGEQYVDDRALVAKAVRAPVDVVLPEGTAVLNADDPDVADMAGKCRGQVIFFAGDAESEPLRDALAKRGDGVFVSGGKIVAARAGQVVPILDLRALSGARAWLEQILVEDLLAAAATGLALGLMPSHMRHGLEQALREPGHALYADGQRRVLVTQARNPSALAAWMRIVEASFPGRRHVVMEVPSDWRERDASAIAEALGPNVATLSLVATDAEATTQNHLCNIIKHSSLAQERSLTAAIDRISAEAGASDFIFVTPSKRSGVERVEEHLRQRNMARSDQPDLATMPDQS
jgi:cyanophycin synthetase